MKDIRSADILGMKITSNEGTLRENDVSVKPGAKDSISSGVNVTEPFAPSATISGPFGGMNKPK